MPGDQDPEQQLADLEARVRALEQMLALGLSRLQDLAKTRTGARIMKWLEREL